MGKDLFVFDIYIKGAEKKIMMKSWRIFVLRKLETKTLKKLFR